MNRIHRKVEYALIALKHMRAKAPGERTTVKEMAVQYGCPHDVLARVLQTLAHRAVLNSEQGVRGGYTIAKDLNRVSFYDLLEMILGPLAVARCLHEIGRFGCGRSLWNARDLQHHFANSAFESKDERVLSKSHGLRADRRGSRASLEGFGCDLCCR